MNDYDPYVIYSGGTVKALGGNRVGGRVVTFSGEQSPDRVGDFFDGSTDFWLNGSGERRPVLYRHGLDGSIKRRRFGEAQLNKGPDGIWASGYIAGADEHSRKLLAMAKAGRLNWSTGSVGHLVAKSPAGSAMHVDEWPIAELSLCPHDTVAEPRNILSLKSFVVDYSAPDLDSLDIPGISLEELEIERLNQRVMNAKARLEILDFCRITGISPQELEV